MWVKAKHQVNSVMQVSEFRMRPSILCLPSCLSDAVWGDLVTSHFLYKYPDPWPCHLGGSPYIRTDTWSCRCCQHRLQQSPASNFRGQHACWTWHPHTHTYIAPTVRRVLNPKHLKSLLPLCRWEEMKSRKRGETRCEVLSMVTILSCALQHADVFLKQMKSRELKSVNM